ncbi:MAG: hypothetical protein WAL75_15695 [Terracidiphilus sp.]
MHRCLPAAARLPSVLRDLLLICAPLFCALFLAIVPPAAQSQDIRIQGPGSPPEIGFACCDKGIAPMQALFATPGLIAQLRQLHALVAVAITDFSPERADTVHMLNREQIPAVAWIMLSSEDGVYLNAGNAPAAATRIKAFEKWTADNNLHWAAVGLDIEPDFDELSRLNRHKWRLITTLVSRSFDGPRIVRAQQAYSQIIHELQAHGFTVQTYQMPYRPAERGTHTSLVDRLLGTVDVKGNIEYLMVYTSFARPIGAGMIWSLGPGEQGITVGVTDGATTPGVGSGPLDWNEFSRDLIVASHFTNHIGVYNLEGAVQQSFMPRLLAMDWNQSVTIPAAQIARARRMRFLSHAVLLTMTYLPWLVVAGVLLIAWLIRRRWVRKRQVALPA